MELETLSVDSKTAYVTGLWDGYIAFFGKEFEEKYRIIVLTFVLLGFPDLVEMVDSLYEQEKIEAFLHILLREKGLKTLYK